MNKHLGGALNDLPQFIAIENTRNWMILQGHPGVHLPIFSEAHAVERKRPVGSGGVLALLHGCLGRIGRSLPAMFSWKTDTGKLGQEETIQDGM